MIKELNKDYKPNWDEKIELSLSLKDLQLIYDCIGAVPLKYINKKHEFSVFRDFFTANDFNNIYNNLDDILVNHNGINDESADVNINIELDMIIEE